MPLAARSRGQIYLRTSLWGLKENGNGREEERPGGFHSARANLYSISQLRVTFNARLLLGATITLLYGRRKLILMIRRDLSREITYDQVARLYK